MVEETPRKKEKYLINLSLKLPSMTQPRSRYLLLLLRIVLDKEARNK
jgi:hypothetical protein